MKNLRLSEINVTCINCGKQVSTFLGSVVQKQKIRCTNCHQFFNLNLNAHSHALFVIDHNPLIDIEKSINTRLN